MQTAEWRRRFITVEEIAALWDVSPGTVIRSAKKGLIPSEKTPSGRRRYLREQVVAHYQSSTGQALVKGE